MINAAELRLGNLFYKINRSHEVHIPDEVPMKIYSIELFKVQYCLANRSFFDAADPNFRWCDTKDLSGIPLSAEWLERFGFTKSKLLGYDNHFKYSIGGLNNGITAIYDSDFSLLCDGVARGIKYVHQLQNLFYALTNTELTLNNK